MKKIILILVFSLFWIITTVHAETIVEELTTLNNLYKEGAISKEEFSKAKSILFQSSSKEQSTEPEEKKETKEVKKKKEEKTKEVKKAKDKKKKKQLN